MTITVLTVIIYSCQKESEVFSEFSDVMYIASNGDTNGSTNGGFAVRRNFYMTFMDLSQGVVSHEWSISGQNGLKFLSSGFSGLDADTLNRQSHIIPDSLLNTKTVNVFFQNEGLYSITWKDVFKDSVGYMTIGSVKDPISKNWVFTKVFQVRVYGPLIPVITIVKNTTEPISSAVDTIRLVIGDNLTFKEASKGYPTARVWTINGGTPNNDTNSTFITKFNKAGIFKSSSLQLSRVVGANVSLNGDLTTTLPVIKVQ